MRTTTAINEKPLSVLKGQCRQGAPDNREEYPGEESREGRKLHDLEVGELDVSL